MPTTKKIISIIGDSLAMPRLEQGISFFDTYEYSLSKNLSNDYYILNKSKRGNTIKNQVIPQYIYDDLEVLHPHAVIIQIGICDCAPRIIGKRETFFLNVIAPKWFKHHYIKFKSKHRIFFTKYIPKVNVQYPLFVKLYRQLIQILSNIKSIEKIIIINICDTNEENKRRSFGFEENIILYNQFINSLKSDKIFLVDIYEMSKLNKDILIEDGIHLSKTGHEYIANQIFSILNEK